MDIQVRRAVLGFFLLVDFGAGACASRTPLADPPEKPFIQWDNPPKSPNHWLTHERYFSQVMATNVGFNIYLPPGYGTKTDRYPVVYWFHGRNCNESNDQYPTSYLDQAIAAGTVPPAIMVYASGGSQSFYSDSYDGKFLSETTIIRELIPYIDRTYRTIARREGRAVQGMSMGGFGALKMAFKYPDLFSSVVGFAGGYVTPAQLRDRMPEIFERMFGRDEVFFMKNHPETLARLNVDQIKNRVAIRLLVGTKDPTLELNRSLHATLTSLGILHEYEELEGAGHDLRGALAGHSRTSNFEFAARHFGDGPMAPR